MKFRIDILFVFVFCVRVTTPVCDDTIKSYRCEQEQSSWQQFFEQELDKIGAKRHYGYGMMHHYLRYMQAALGGEVCELNQRWLEFQAHQAKFREAQTPVVLEISKACVGYWLYRRLAYPVSKKNWGVVKKAAASIAIPAWLFSSAVLFDPELDKKRESLREEIEKKYKALELKYSVLEIQQQQDRKLQDIVLENSYEVVKVCRQELDKYRSELAQKNLEIEQFVQKTQEAQKLFESLSSEKMENFAKIVDETCAKIPTVDKEATQDIALENSYETIKVCRNVKISLVKPDFPEEGESLKRSAQEDVKEEPMVKSDENEELPWWKAILNKFQK